MKLVSWNVNGLRACITKGFDDVFKNLNADIFCIQETKMQEDQAESISYDGYYKYMNSAEKKGYSGTAIFTKLKPLSVTYGIGIEEHDKEGRIITLEYDKFFLVNCYTLVIEMVGVTYEAGKRKNFRFSYYGNSNFIRSFYLLF